MKTPRLVALLLTTLGAAFAPASLPAQVTLVQTGGTFRSDAVNLAAASNGATAIFSSELSAYDHFGAEVNDGVYGNASSWIGGIEVYGWPTAWVGVAFNTPQTIASFAFGRDNTGVQESRATWATYAVEYTTSAFTPGSAGSATWITVVNLDYYNAPPSSPALRHLYDFTSPLAGVTGFRLNTSSGLGYGNAIDEIEVYATSAAVSAIPEPSTYAALFGALVLGLAAWRRRR
jgi:hypothetical protein